MGVYDRDWWREHQREQAKKQEASRPEAQKTRTTPDVPGVDWHWTVKLLAFTTCATALYLAAKLIMIGMRL